MALRRHKPTSSGRRQRSDFDFKILTKKKPEKALLRPKRRTSGRGSAGRITVRHRGGGAKRRYRLIDFKRNKDGIEATVNAIEYDPNRGANVALLVYKDGEKRYILAPQDLKVGAKVSSGEDAEINAGNALPLKKIPVGSAVHNLELTPGRGGQMARGAGTAAIVQSKEEKGYVQVKLPSGEVRKFRGSCKATLGQVGNMDRKNITWGKAGRVRHLGFRPAVRGVAQHPGSHPHGGGEGRSGIGMKSPKSPWGKRTLGKKTRTRKHTRKYIVKDRRK